MNEKEVNAGIVLNYSDENMHYIDETLAKAVTSADRKIVVLDDDPTGVQTVHDVNIYTDWSQESIDKGFAEKSRIFFILTNSRGFTEERTIAVHREIAENIVRASHKYGKEFIIVSRSDSTLRGHYPTETAVIRSVLEQNNEYKLDGEIICPFFREGGRFTIGNVHYVEYGDTLVPCAQTEFAQDETFGYKSSDLCEYIEEKTQGKFKADSVKCIDLYTLRTMNFEKIADMLCSVNDFNKIIVNATDDYDIKVLAIAFYKAVEKGKHFIFRSAASLVKSLADISSIPLLEHDSMINDRRSKGGIIVVGSHTAKTTNQLEKLRRISEICFVEMDSDLVLDNAKLAKEVDRIVDMADEYIENGKTICIYTKRQLLRISGDTPEAALVRSVAISDAVQSCVGKLKSRPSFVVAKGGITSSDVGTKALKVKCAKVLGQIMPGVPVWETGIESKFPGIPYIIFPGNVGDEDTLYDAVKKLI